MSRFNRRHRQYIDSLQGVTLFSECNAAELRLVASLLTPITVRSGRVLARQGELGRECFVIVSGHAVVEHDGAIVGHAVAGSIVGELALMGERRRTATVTAATEMSVLAMSQTEFASLRALGITSLDRQLEATAAEHRAALHRVTTTPAPSSAENDPAEVAVG
jgi:voltage-gated potassium channel